MGKESEYTFAKLSGAENYKEWAREMIFALKDSGIIITSPDNVPMQISNVMSVEKRDIYTGTVLGRVNMVDNKARILRHLP